MCVHDSREIINIERAISKDPGGSYNLSVKNMFAIDFYRIFHIKFFSINMIKNDSNELFKKFFLEMDPRKVDPVRGRIKMKKVK